MKRSPEQIGTLVKSLAAHGLGGINPTEEQYRTLLADERGGVVQYVNLLKYKEWAEYPDGHELSRKGFTGAEAYVRYGEVAIRKVAERGGRLIVLNGVEQLLIGESEDWDRVAIMEYPNREAFIDMIEDPEYREAIVHRDAGLERTLIFITRSLLPAV